MRTCALGVALALSISFAFVAHAEPQRGQGDEVPGGEPGTKPVLAALEPSWKLLGSTTRPAARMSSYAIVDDANDRMVVFGGWGFGYFSDTWALDLASGMWSPVKGDTTHPGPRMEYASIHDTARNRMIVFGGKDPFTNEVWALDLSGTPTWTRLATAGTPPTPRESRAIYDPVRDRMVVFGGYSPVTSPRHLNETWELTLSGTPTWHQLATTGGPPAPRRGQTAVYDAPGDRMIVFGGYDDATFMNDVWALDLGTSTWQQLFPGGDPVSGRYGHAATFDPDRREMVVFGGYRWNGGPIGYDGGYLNDLYVLSLSGTPTWTHVNGTPTPPVRDFHSLVYDGARHRVVLFGRNSGPVYNDLWALDTGTRTWSSLDLYTPPPRMSSYAVTDANSQRLVLFGGYGGQYLDDTWTLALDQTPPLWIAHAPANHPSARLEHATAYDSNRDQMLLFGGKDATQFYNDVWQLDLTGDPAWSPISTAGTPPSPRECRAVYDPVRDRLLLFGGFSPTAHHLNETWELTLSGTPTWHQLSPTGPLPPARRGQNMIYDPVSDEALVFGGYDDNTFYNDVWSLSFDGGQEHWTQLHPSGVGPGPRYGASATLDPVRRQMIVFGGYDGHYLNDGYALSLDGPRRWTALDAPTLPGPRDFHTMAYDPGGDRLLLFGGNDGHAFGDLWQLSFGNPILLPPPVALGAGEPKLAVSGVSLAPGSRMPLLQVTVPSMSSARLELFDVAGRRLADRPFTPAAVGKNAIPLAEARGLRAGIYLVRVTQGGASAVGRALVVP